MEDIKQGMIVYCDAGSRPNPGKAGWGYHGYLYSDVLPKKGTGNGSWLLTKDGYLPKNGIITTFEVDPVEGADSLFATDDDDDKASDKPKQIREEIDLTGITEITPIQYVDAFGAIPYDTSNNVAEITAATMALRYAKEWSVATVDVYTDSRYTRDGLTNWIEGWKRNGWIKKDGLPIANVETWKELDAARAELQARGTRVTLHWIESHNGHQGNENADELATIGVLHARAGNFRTQITTSPPEGYWKYDHKRHPFLNHPRVYFNTQSAFNKPGEYYIGNHGKDDEMLGKRISDGAFAAVFLKEPEAVVEAVRNHQIELAKDQHTLVMIRMDQLYKTNTHAQIMEYGPLAMDRPTAWRLDLNTVDKQPLTREFKPPLIAWRAVEAITFLVGQLNSFQAGSQDITTTDLTAILYETVITPSKKKGGEPTKTISLKSDYNVGYAALGVEANYRTDLGEIKKINIMLSLGIDLLDRNSLNRLASREPVVTLITWADSATSFRYATVIQAGDDVGIWCGVYSNLRIIPS